MAGDNKEQQLIKDREKAQLKLYEAKVGLHKARLEAEELNRKLVEAGLLKHAAPCW